MTRSPSLEAQVVNLADEIAYTAHDCEDGLNAGLLNLTDLLNIPLAKQAYDLAEKRGSSLRGSLIHLLVHDLYKSINDSLSSHRITTLETVYSAQDSLAIFTSETRSSLDALRGFLWQEMYSHSKVLERAKAGQDIAGDIHAGVELRLLRKITDLDAVGRPGLAVELGIEPGHDLQQCRLAGAVQAEDADLGARKEGQADVLQHFLAAGPGFGQAVHHIDVLVARHNIPR